MAYTQTDLDNIDTAILDYGLGRRVGTVIIGDNTVKFSDVTLTELRSLRSQVAAQVADASGSSSFVPRTRAKNGGRR